MIAAKMLKVHRERARKEVQELVMGTRSSADYDMKWIVYEMWGVKDDKRRILDVDSHEGMTRFESSTLQSTILQEIKTPAQKELWRFFG